ncbi:MAG: hypothetical protein HY719_05420 [Planctomycetes bacterium]|nr:hypothetical protein [Planctomycetota bacterium]
MRAIAVEFQPDNPRDLAAALKVAEEADIRDLVAVAVAPTSVRGLDLAAEARAAATLREGRRRVRALAARSQGVAGPSPSPAAMDDAARGAALAGLISLSRRAERLACDLALIDPVPAVFLAGGDGANGEGEGDGAASRAKMDAGAAQVAERLCRALFDLLRARPNGRFAFLTPGHPSAAPGLAALDLVLGEFPAGRLGYWHDAARAERMARTGVARHEEWLTRFDRRMLGVYLTDLDPRTLEAGPPPGLGCVDWAVIRAALGAGVIRAFVPPPSMAAGDMLLAIAALGEKGLF